VTVQKWCPFFGVWRRGYDCLVAILSRLSCSDFLVVIDSWSLSFGGCPVVANLVVAVLS
jgi:hypothetical protein